MNQKQKPCHSKSPINRCTFPGCDRQIRPGARMCTRHHGMIWSEKQTKRSRGKTDAEIIEYVREKEDERRKLRGFA